MKAAPAEAGTTQPPWPWPEAAPALAVDAPNGEHLSDPSLLARRFGAGALDLAELLAWPPPLLAVHELFHREHNRLAGEIAAACAAGGRDRSDEDMFQGARRLVVATRWKTRYEDLLPALLGRGVERAADLVALVPDPAPIGRAGRAINGFTAAAGRIGHSQVPDVVLLAEPGRASRAVPLSARFFDPGCLGGASLDAIRYGATILSAEAVDPVLVDSLRDALRPGFDATFLIDLLAANIQRGRDHGLPDCMTMRAALGFRGRRARSRLRRRRNAGPRVAEARRAPRGAVPGCRRRRSLRVHPFRPGARPIAAASPPRRRPYAANREATPDDTARTPSRTARTRFGRAPGFGPPRTAEPREQDRPSLRRRRADRLDADAEMSSAAGRRVVSAGHPSAERRTSDEGLSGVDVGALARVLGMPAHALSDQRAAPTGPRLPAA
ncbi:MAG: hypothetical protein EA355_10710, partial [Rhodobacteraceae bacterium]